MLDHNTSTCNAALSPTIASYTVPVHQARGLPPTSFRFRLTTNTLVFGYVFPATGQTPVFHRLETCAAGRTRKRAVPSTSVEGTALLVDKCTRFLYLEEMTGKRKLPKA